jgi:tetratricopeptide (TPR) repeat protein
VVRVRGPGLPAEGQTVTAPQLSPSRELPAPPGEASVPAPVPEPAVTPPTARWLPKFRSLLQSGELEAAVRLIPSGFPAEAVGATAKDLLDAGDLLAAAGQSARAEASYARVCVLAKGEGPCGLAQVRLAIARGNAGDAEAALSWARRYLTANPTGAFAPEMSGRRMTWLIALGRQSEALEAARDVLERWPDSKPWAAQARALLKAP